MAGATQVTLFYFTWYDEQLGRAVQAPRPATVSAILEAGGEPIVDSAHQVAASDINELGFKRRPTRRCDACGESLEYQGSWFDGSSLNGSQPRRDQVFGCPRGHEVWAFIDPMRQWRRRWPSITSLEAPAGPKPFPRRAPRNQTEEPPAARTEQRQ